MLKIRETKVGETVTITLLVKDAQIKFTKAKKPYLFVTLTDGSDDIQGQDWDYGDKPPFARNTVLDVRGEISEYMGRKQIKILTAMVVNNADVSLFAPTDSDLDIDLYINKASYLIDEIKNEHARALVRQVFNDNAKGWKSIPAAAGIHHAFVAGLLKHSVDVAYKARAIAQLTPMCNADLVIAGALLHDMGKLWTYELNGAVIDMTDEGQMVEHIMLGAIKLEAYRTAENTKIVDLIQHIISSHHGRLEYGSPTTPRFLEAVIVNAADGVDAKSQTIIEANHKTPAGDKFTAKLYTMENRAMFSQSYISEIMEVYEV